MKFYRIAAVLFACLVSASAVWSQDPAKPVNFSGRWVLERVNEYPGSTGLRTRNGEKLEMELLVTQTADELKVKESTSGTEKYARDCIYYLDGRGESNNGFSDGFLYVSRSKLLNDRIIVETDLQRSKPSLGSLRIEEWSLSADGKTLTIKTKATANQTNRPRPMGINSLPTHYDRIFKLVS